MVIIDSSAWIAFLRDGEGPTADGVAEVLKQGSGSTCGVIEMEILAGARSERHLQELEALLGDVDRLSIEAFDYSAAAQIYRQCRAQGVTPRGLEDCLIGAVALRSGAEVLHNDRDFERLGEVTGVRTRRS